jgi:hypothetical protein
MGHYPPAHNLPTTHVSTCVELHAMLLAAPSPKPRRCWHDLKHPATHPTTLVWYTQGHPALDAAANPTTCCCCTPRHMLLLHTTPTQTAHCTAAVMPALQSVLPAVLRPVRTARCTASCTQACTYCQVYCQLYSGLHVLLSVLPAVLRPARTAWPSAVLRWVP